MSGEDYPLRPFLPTDTLLLRELYAQSIEELTADDYDEDQRAAWASMAEDTDAFGRKLASMVTLVVERDGERLGFGSLKDNTRIEMLYVHPYSAGEGVGSALLNAIEKIAAARGASALTVEASDAAEMFFEGKGYVAEQRNSVPLGDQWLTNTTMKKTLTAGAAQGSREAGHG